MAGETVTIPKLRCNTEQTWFVERGGATRRGQMHSKNQDYYAFGKSGQSFALFDGMGGPPYGDIASRIGANVAIDSYEDGLTLRNAMDAARNAISTVGIWLHSEGMGSTALMAVVDGDNLELSWLGDTVAILVRNSESRILTEPDRAMGRGNAITGCFGAGIEREVHECSFALEEADIVVLCTDGVWTAVDETTLISVIAQQNNPAPEIAYDLVFKMAQDSTDDCSAIVLRFSKEATDDIGNHCEPITI